MARDGARFSLLWGYIAASALLIFLASCGGQTGPDHTARSFLKAIHDQDCEKAWRFFSSDTQRMIVDEAARLKTEGAGRGANGVMYTDDFEYKNLYCKSTMVNPYLAYRPNSVKLIKMESDYAIVSVQEAEAGGFLIPGFLPTKTILHQREIKLVKERDSWKVDRTR